MKILEFVKSPEFKLLAGAVLGGVGVGLACKATLEAEDILDIHEGKVEMVKEKYIQQLDNGDVLIEDQKEYKKELTKTFFCTGKELALAYALPAALFGFSAILIGGTYRDIKSLKKERTELISALIGKEAILNRYRADMRERVGEEAEQRFFNNISTQDIEFMEVDEEGKQKKRKVKGADVINDELSGYAFIFDESCGAYVGHDIDHNLFVASCLKNQLSDNLFANGSLLLFEILDAYGLDRDKIPEAFIAGRLSQRKGGPSDVLEMDIRTVWVVDEATGQYVEKILIDPKLDGVIVHRI